MAEHNKLLAGVSIYLATEIIGLAGDILPKDSQGAGGKSNQGVEECR